MLGIIVYLGIWLAGTFATYIYDRHSSLPYRICVGVIIGQVFWGLLTFILAFLFGQLTVPSIIFSVGLLIVVSYLISKKYQSLVRKEIELEIQSGKQLLTHPTKRYIITGCYYVLLLGVLWISMRGAVEYKSGAYVTRSSDNYADLTLHTGIVTSFVYGNNFPPQHPDYAGAKMSYPFLVDFIAAILVKLGLTLPQAFFLQNFTTLTAFTGLLHMFTKRLTQNHTAALLAPLIFFTSGGLGWMLLFSDIKTVPGGWGELLTHLPHDYSSYLETIRWGNAIVYWLIPMRTMVVSFPLFVIVAEIWWRLLSGKERINYLRLSCGAAIITGLVPLVHTHTFITLVGVGILLTLIFRRWKVGISFVVLALIVGLPQVGWLVLGTTAKMSTFLGFIKGWNQADPNLVHFWLVNTGIFIPLIIIAFFHKNLLSAKLRLFYLPFILCFIFPNFVKLAPWEWDNIKILVYWFLASIPLISLLLAHWWQRHGILRLIAVVCLVLLIAAGSLDIWRVISNTQQIQVFSPTIVSLAEAIKQDTPPRAIILTAPLHHNPVLLTGRQSFMGYPGRLWTHGIEYTDREIMVKVIYAGDLDARQLLKQNHIDYVVVGEMERYWAQDQHLTLDEDFFQQFTLLSNQDGNRLYRVE